MFIDDKEKMYNFIGMNKKDFLQSYSYLTEKEYDDTVDALWEDLGEVPIDNRDLIQTDWYIFPKGTERFDIWAWFESNFNCSVAMDLMKLPEEEV